LTVNESTRFCVKCGSELHAGNEYCPKCGTAVGGTAPVAQTPAQPTAQRGFMGGSGKWVILGVVIIVVFLFLPIFPRTTIVYVNGTTQTVTNSTSFSTSLQVVTQSTQSQISVYTGSFQYFSSNYYSSYYNYNPWGQCYWAVFGGHSHIVCNYSQWYWYQPTYGTTVTVTPNMNVVNVIRTPGSSSGGYYSGYYQSESLVLVYSNGQQSQTYQNVYVDNLAPSGTSTIPSTTVVTNTIVNSVVNPVTQTIPCTQCVPTTVTNHVSLLQLLFGY